MATNQAMLNLVMSSNDFVMLKLITELILHMKMTV